MPRNAAAALKGAEEWNELPSAEEIEQRKRMAEWILSHMDRPVTRYEERLWQALKAELERELQEGKDRDRGANPPLNAPATPEEMEHRERVIARIQARMAKPASEADKRLWQKFIAELERERPTFRS